MAKASAAATEVSVEGNNTGRPLELCCQGRVFLSGLRGGKGEHTDLIER